MKTTAHWEKIGISHHHGICVPLFSLRTKNSPDMGEFFDLFLLIDWCKKVRFDCLQLLPLNDTGDDLSPYNPVSAFAIDPTYLCLRDLPNGKKLPDLTGLDRIKIKEKKLQWLRVYFQENFSPNPSFLSFVKQNPWLDTYALFIIFREKFQKAHWNMWPDDCKQPHPSHFQEFENEIQFYRFVQFLCFSQLQQVKEYATKQKVFLKGDLQFLLSTNSADVWAERSFFNLDFSAGTPPDAFNPLGQNWGFPLFNWEALRKNNYEWCRRRLKLFENFYHIYRIDHVVGLFRIWAIAHDPQKEASFIPPNPADWEAHGREVLEMFIESSDLLPIAEDLGTVPPQVFSVLEEFGICGTKVVRWEMKDKKYIPLSQYPKLSLTTLSTPDTDCLEGWWKNYPDESIPFATFMKLSYTSSLSKRQRLKILKATHHSASFFHVNLFQEYLNLFPELSWKNPAEDRINIPGMVLPGNWTYRYRVRLEEIVNHKQLQEAIAKILD